MYAEISATRRARDMKFGWKLCLYCVHMELVSKIKCHALHPCKWVIFDCRASYDSLKSLLADTESWVLYQHILKISVHLDNKHLSYLSKYIIGFLFMVYICPAYLLSPWCSWCSSDTDWDTRDCRARSWWDHLRRRDDNDRPPPRPDACSDLLQHVAVVKWLIPDPHAHARDHCVWWAWHGGVYYKPDCLFVICSAV